MGKKMTCCICGEIIRGYGNNAWPVDNVGICCDTCNSKIVIPARIEQLKRKEDSNGRKEAV